MSNVGNEVIIETGKFALDSKVSEDDEDSNGDTDDHNNTDNENADLRIIERESRGDYITFAHLFIDNIIRNIPVNPETKESKPGNLCKDEGKENKKLGLMFLHNCNNKNKKDNIL